MAETKEQILVRHLRELKTAVECLVCTEGKDMGVVLIMRDPVNRTNDPLSDALMGLHERIIDGLRDAGKIP